MSNNNNSNSNKNYKLLNNNNNNNSNININNNNSSEDEDDLDDNNHSVDLLPLNRIIQQPIQNGSISNQREEDGEEEEEDDDNLANSSTTLFQKIKNNISNSFRKNKEENIPIVDNDGEEDEDVVDYSYYTSDDSSNSNSTSSSNNTSPTSTTSTTTTTTTTTTIPNEHQIPLYSISSSNPTWFMRSSDPYSLENQIINHMRSNSRIEVLQQQAASASAALSSNGNGGNNNNNNNNNLNTYVIDMGDNSTVFRPFSNNFLSEQHQLSEQQNNLIKDKDIVIIQQPNNRMSIGFSDSKFTNYLKSGEHNPSGFYNSFIQNDEMIQRLTMLTSPTNNNGTVTILGGDDSSEISDFGMYRLSHLELEKRKKLFLSILCIQLFYYCILLSSFTSFHILILFLFIGLLNNCLALVTIKRQNILGLSLFLVFEIVLILVNYFTDFTTLLILRSFLFMIGYKLRHEMIIFQSYSHSI